MMTPTTSERAESRKPALVRAIGRWSLTALLINATVGSSIFGVPSVIAATVGGYSTIAFLIAAVLIMVIVACYAEVGSQFAVNGGTYFYIREAFGRFAGIQAAWFTLLSAFAARAAAANLFVSYLGEFWPEATRPVPRFVIITVLIAALAGVNYFGVRSGTRMSNLLVLSKLLPLAIVLVGGVYWVMTHGRVPMAVTDVDTGSWLKAILILLFTYGGFETGLAPMGEAKDPRRDVPFALFAGLLVVALLYVLTQWTVMSILSNPAVSLRPMADVAGIVFGRGGPTLVSAAVMLCILGYLSAGMLASPRYTFALAEQGDFPKLFAAVHPKYRTPHVSIVFFALLIWPLALLGSFSWNITLSAVAKLMYYGMVCASVPRLRRKNPEISCFRLPLGWVFPLLGVGICVVLLAAVDLSRWMFLAGTFFVAVLNWMWVIIRK
jgi:amino acid transporter